MGKARYEQEPAAGSQSDEGEKQQKQLMVKEARITMTLGIREPCVVLEIAYTLIQKVVIHTCTFTHIYVCMSIVNIY